MSANAGTVGVVPYLAVPDVMVRPCQSLNSVLYVFASHWAYRVVSPVTVRVSPGR